MQRRARQHTVGLRSRRGVIALFTVLLFLAMLSVVAVVLDFGRMQFMRNQMQTAADAAALAGAVQLLRSSQADYVSQAQTFAQANTLLGSSIVLNDSDVVLGTWTSPERVFTRGGSPSTANAVQITLRHTSTSILAGVIGWAPKQIAVRSVAWAGPAVSQTKCMKPWAIPYVNLRGRINSYLGLPDDPVTDTASLSQADLQALREMSDVQRTFTLKVSQWKDIDPGMPGNFGAVDLPPVMTADGTPGTPGTGGAVYQENIEGVDGAGNPVCWTVGVGDELQTEPGNMVGPTNKGITDALCTQTDPSLSCIGADGNNPIIKSAFFVPGGKAKGRTTVTVDAIGSFKLTKWDGNQLTGVFVPAQDKGPVGPGNTTLQRVVLVK
ncbi:MAG: pilus assembly protein TadG-related protein [Gemmatimonadaceae bacterium]